MPQLLVDLHTHTLPAMDDGSKDVEMSLQMLRRLAGQGVRIVCCTSHFYAERESIEEFRQRRRQALQMLRKASPAELPRLVPGAETAWFPNMSQHDLAPLCLYKTRTLLVEMPFAVWSSRQMDEVTSLVLDQGYQVVLVHPERFCFSHSNRTCLEKLADLPIGFQVNADTLLKWNTRKLGLELLEMAPYPLLGSDCHNLTSRPPHMEEAGAIICRRFGEEFLEEMNEAAKLALLGKNWEL